MPAGFKGFDSLSGFTAGQKLGAGQSSFAAFAQSLTDRAKALLDPRAQLAQSQLQLTNRLLGKLGGEKQPFAAQDGVTGTAELGVSPGLTGGGGSEFELQTVTISESGTAFKIGKSEQAKARIESKQKIIEERRKRADQVQSGFLKTSALMEGLVSQLKLKLQEQGGKGGLIEGGKGVFRRLVKDPTAKGIASFPGQRRESALALNNVLTGQNRAIKGVIDMILKTFPDELDQPGPAAQKIAQTMTNAFRLLKAGTLKGLDWSKVDENMPLEEVTGLIESVTLTPEENQQVEQIIQRVLNAPIAKSRELPGFESSGQNGAPFPTTSNKYEEFGTDEDTGRKVGKRKSDGRWEFVR